MAILVSLQFLHQWGENMRVAINGAEATMFNCCVLLLWMCCQKQFAVVQAAKMCFHNTFHKRWKQQLDESPGIFFWVNSSIACTKAVNQSGSSYHSRQRVVWKYSERVVSVIFPIRAIINHNFSVTVTQIKAAKDLCGQNSEQIALWVPSQLKQNKSVAHWHAVIPHVFHKALTSVISSWQCWNAQALNTAVSDEHCEGRETSWLHVNPLANECDCWHLVCCQIMLGPIMMWKKKKKR